MALPWMPFLVFLAPLRFLTVFRFRILIKGLFEDLDLFEFPEFFLIRFSSLWSRSGFKTTAPGIQMKFRGNPTILSRPVVFRPYLTVGLALLWQEIEKPPLDRTTQWRLYIGSLRIIAFLCNFAMPFVKGGDFSGKA